MSKTFLKLVILTSIFFKYCKSAQQKETIAKENVVEAKQDLSDTKISNANYWIIFKVESRSKIIDNEKRIAEIRVKINEPFKPFNGLYRTQSKKLEAKNSELKSKLNNYNGNQTE